MIPDKKVMCHHTGFSKSCFECVTEHGCQKWVNILGTNPQTGETMNKFACADSIAHFLMLENSLMQRQTAAAVESFRNEVVRLNQYAPSERLELENANHNRA